jgi:peptidoglycan/xylan/chitin deacetylase (PgdA/CDA1 family)
MVVRWLIALIAIFSASPSDAEKRIALSFDDIPRFTGPELSREERQKMLIAGLKRAGVKQAVFFVNPAKLEETGSPPDESAITRYARAGHVLANHTDNHLKLGDVSADEYLAHIDRAEAWLKGRKGRRPWFRFTYLDEGGRDKAKRDAVRAGLKARGLRNGYVTAEAVDWHMLNLWVEAAAAGKSVERKALCAFYARHHLGAAEFADDLAQKALGRSPAHVMLLHETDLAAHCIGDLVSALRGAGWIIITADKAYADPIGSVQPDVPSAQGGLIEAIAWEKGLSAPRWYEFNDTNKMAADFKDKVLKESSVQ